MKPSTNKTKMVTFLRARGYDVPSIRRSIFSKHRDSFWLDWQDSADKWHKAYYSAAGGRPIFYVDRHFIDITLAEVIDAGMVTENHPTPKTDEKEITLC